MDIIFVVIDDVRFNVKWFGVMNIYYVVGIVEDLLFKWFKEGFKFDVIVVDFLWIGLDCKLLMVFLK